MADYTALYDACCLYPNTLRDTLIRLTLTGLFRAKWTEQINDEWVRNLIKGGGDPARVHRTRDLMNRAVPDCLVIGYEYLIEQVMLSDPNDRHVLAAAIVGHADVIVTLNLKHFPPDILAQYDIEPQHPDEFIADQFELNEAAVLKAFKEQRASLKRPAMNPQEFIDSLGKAGLPQTVEILRAAADLI